MLTAVAVENRCELDRWACRSQKMSAMAVEATANNQGSPSLLCNIIHYSLDRYHSLLKQLAKWNESDALGCKLTLETSGRQV